MWKQINFSEPVFSLRGWGSVCSGGLPHIPFQVQGKMSSRCMGLTINSVGEEILGIPHNCSEPVQGQQIQWEGSEEHIKTE